MKEEFIATVTLADLQTPQNACKRFTVPQLRGNLERPRYSPGSRMAECPWSSVSVFNFDDDVVLAAHRYAPDSHHFNGPEDFRRHHGSFKISASSLRSSSENSRFQGSRGVALLVRLNGTGLSANAGV